MSRLRIQKYLSQQGVLSRREAEAAIFAGKVKLNGKIVREMGVQIDPAVDKVEVMNAGGPAKRTLAFNKPRGLETEKIIESKPEFTGLNPVGRLDKESEGLILLSNDGIVTKAVTGEEHLVEKEYEITAQENVPPGKLHKMEEGITLGDGPTLPAKAEKLGSRSFLLTIREGRKHQIRRMCDALRLTVAALKRVRIGDINLGKLKSGQFRPLSEREIKILKDQLR